MVFEDCHHTSGAHFYPHTMPLFNKFPSLRKSIYSILFPSIDLPLMQRKISEKKKIKIPKRKPKQPLKYMAKYWQ